MQGAWVPTPVGRCCRAAQICPRGRRAGCWVHGLGWDVRIKCRQHTGREAIRATLRGAPPSFARNRGLKRHGYHR